MARPRADLRTIFDSMTNAPAAPGLLLMASAIVAMLIANSAIGPTYAHVLHHPIGPLTLHGWVNDGLMSIFFLLVGLEIKREVIEGQLSSWPRRILPGVAAIGGMTVPALIYLVFNSGATAQGWAVPAATDIAFALGVIALLGNRVPLSLRIFLTALAIIDDLGAVLIIAFFYTASLSPLDLAGAALVTVTLFALNRFGISRLTPYLCLGLILWILVLRSGIHATLAGVILAFAIPLRASRHRPDAAGDSPLHRLEHGLNLPVAFLILPLFGLINAGVPIYGLGWEDLLAPVTMGATLGLLMGKLVGVFGTAMIAIRLGIADMPFGASRSQLAGTALLCGIGFTMSLFITQLAFSDDMVLQTEAKIGILAGSTVSGLLGFIVLRFARKESATA